MSLFFMLAGRQYSPGSVYRQGERLLTDTMHRSPDGGVYIYAKGSNLSTVKQLQAVSGAGEGGFSGAGLAAG